ncbi:MAG: hypothetical protein Q7J29_15840 [Stagnimonas sp.]|nr:hypothetical protein [Stagnimonas sp.]
MRAFKIALAIVFMQCSTLLWAADVPVAGTASIVAGVVSAVATNGESRLLNKGDAVYSGDRIITSASSYVRLGFLDGGSMVLRPNTEFAIVGFRFQPGVVESTVPVVQPKSATPASEASPAPALQIGSQSGVGNQAFFRLVRGGFRAVSGLVGKINREEYSVATPVATIGIRGTLYTSVFCDAVCAADSMVQGQLPAGEAALGGTVSAVDQGSIVIVSNAGQTVTVNASQFILTTAAGTHVSLPGLPGFLGAENWLKAAQQAASSSTPSAATGTSSLLASSTLSTVPTVAGISAAIAATAAALIMDAEDNTSTSTSPATGPTSTAAPTGAGSGTGI